MDNNDVLIRLRYALDIKDTDMVKVFDLGGLKYSKEEVRKILTKTDDGYFDEANSHDDEDGEGKEGIKCTDRMLESFLNGFITFKRGKQEVKPGQPERPAFIITTPASRNNVLLKKLKIALSLTAEDMLDILDEGPVYVTKGELGAFLRKEGHKNYKDCMDQNIRNFLKGLAVKYRK